jgi:response regulator RpfG family c-di-GMP phosphodiesterase
VAYAGADASMWLLSLDIRKFVLRMLMVFSGFIILIIACGLWVADYNIIFPIKTMARTANGFISEKMDQQELDEHVRNIRSINVHTGDEMEDLYNSICRMSSEMAEQMRDIRHYADNTTKMQSGLIITMADMVESRDSDTGAHVQKTAAYVRIILEGLKRKGYYSEKLSPEYMTAVEMSAPLHDVGKINISDTILNKPGKLTDEEYEIMKTHTTAGKNIMEKAISTVRGESYLKEARNMAAYHHERWDGRGYPEGLHGEVIPLSARVMAVADVFDALTSPRVYKPAFPLDKALEMIQEGAGTQFDPKCVEVFMDSLPEVKAVLKKYHNM